MCIGVNFKKNGLTLSGNSLAESGRVKNCLAVRFANNQAIIALRSSFFLKKPSSPNQGPLSQPLTCLCLHRLLILRTSKTPAAPQRTNLQLVHVNSGPTLQIAQIQPSSFNTVRFLCERLTNPPSRSPAGFSQRIQKHLLILIILKNRFSAIPPAHHMIGRSRIFYPDTFFGMRMDL